MLAHDQLIGEMDIVAGSVEFGGKLAYCQQNGQCSAPSSVCRRADPQAWIQNATLRDNVLFGKDWDEGRYWQSIQDASLLADLEILPDGDLTEVCFKICKPVGN